MRLAMLLLLPGALLAQDVHVKVDSNGPGSIASTTDYKTIQQALDHAPEARPSADGKPGRIFIHIVPGTYAERIHVTRNRPRITLLGEGKGPEDVVITAAQNARSAGGTFFTETAEINGDNFEADNVTFANTAGPTGQAVAAAVRSDRAVFKHCRFLGDQDTLFADFGRQLYLDSYVEGGVDFIFGNAAAVFEGGEVHEIRNGYLTAQSRTAEAQSTGYVFDHVRITRSECLANAPECRSRAEFRFFLGRPWRPYARVVVMNSEIPADLEPEGWSLWGKDDATPKAFYAEFHNSGPGAYTGQRAPWAHQLTAREAEAYTPARFLAGSDHWDALAEAARLP